MSNSQEDEYYQDQSVFYSSLKVRKPKMAKGRNNNDNERENGIKLQNILRHRGDNQQDCIAIMADNDVSIITGPPGTGKTFMACGLAATRFCNRKVKNIFMTRPMIQCGRNGGGLGYLKGDLSDKVEPFMKPLIVNFEFFFGKRTAEALIMQGAIEITPIELVRGRSFEDTFMIVDEAQNCTAEQLDMLVSRLDQGSQIVFTGDLDQIDLPHNESYAFKDFIRHIQNVKGVGIGSLTNDDIQRKTIVGKIMEARRSGKYEDNHRR